MSTLQARKIYDALVESGELKTLYSSMKGTWEKDERAFLRQYEANQKLIDDASSVIDLDEDLDGDFAGGF